MLTRGQLLETSNYCFGEGGAGTFSDRKLYTRTKDRLAVSDVLHTLVEHGADPSILVDSRPHIGSNLLPKVLVSLREKLETLGVVYQFEEEVIDIKANKQKVSGVLCASGLEIEADIVILAVGHSARHLYQKLHELKIQMTPKSFAVGVRIEHPQPMIDKIQYGKFASHPLLPAAFYHLTATCQNRGVYSFCMCPGGWIVPAATEPLGVCVNGMSLKRRDSPFANSAIVVSVEPQDYISFSKSKQDVILSGMDFQRELEQRAFQAGGGHFIAPAQRLDDVIENRPSLEVIPSSYRPGIKPAHFGHILPHFVWKPLQESLLRFQRTLPGFVTKMLNLLESKLALLPPFGSCAIYPCSLQV